MSTTVISCGSTRFPEDGRMAAAPGSGVNLIELLLTKGAKAREINISASGHVAVFVNGEELKPYFSVGELLKFTYKGEGQAPGGKKYGTIESLEIIGDGQFNMIATE